MNRIHALAASIIIGLAAIFGLAAMAKTAGVGETKPAASQVSDEVIAARQRKLNRAQKALQKARAQKPPALPAASARTVSSSRAQVISQPAPVVRAASASRSFDDDHEDEFEDD